MMHPNRIPNSRSSNLIVYMCISSLLLVPLLLYVSHDEQQNQNQNQQQQQHNQQIIVPIATTRRLKEETNNDNSTATFTCPLPDKNNNNNISTINETYNECQKNIIQNKCDIFSISSYYARYYICYNYTNTITSNNDTTTTSQTIQVQQVTNDKTKFIPFTGCWHNDVSYNQCNTIITNGCTVIDTSYGYLNRYVCYDSTTNSKKSTTGTCPSKSVPCTNSNSTRQCNLLQKSNCTNIDIRQSKYTIESITDACSIEYNCLDDDNSIAGTDSSTLPIFQCPIPSGKCITDESYNKCQQLVKNGCQVVVTTNVCPVQFVCADTFDFTTSITMSTTTTYNSTITYNSSSTGTSFVANDRTTTNFNEEGTNNTTNKQPAMTVLVPLYKPTKKPISIIPPTTSYPINIPTRKPRTVAPLATLFPINIPTLKPQTTIEPTTLFPINVPTNNPVTDQPTTLVPINLPTRKPRTLKPKTTYVPTLYPTTTIPTTVPTSNRPTKLLIPTTTPTNLNSPSPTAVLVPNSNNNNNNNNNLVFDTVDDDQTTGTTAVLDASVTLLLYADMDCLGEEETSLTFITYSQPNNYCYSAEVAGYIHSANNRHCGINDVTQEVFWYETSYSGSTVCGDDNGVIGKEQIYTADTCLNGIKLKECVFGV